MKRIKRIEKRCSIYFENQDEIVFKMVYEAFEKLGYKISFTVWDDPYDYTERIYRLLLIPIEMETNNQ